MIRKTRRMLEAEKLIGEPVETYITRRLNEGDRLGDIAEDLHVTGGAMSYWMLRLGIHKGAYTAAGSNANDR